jgi:5-formyltetrahydrofolate cyclo-ligase
MGSSGLDKTELRRHALKMRAKFNHRPAAAEAVTAALKKLFHKLSHGRTIAGYYTMGDEMDCRPAVTAAAEAGYPTCLPVAAHGQHLIFRAWKSGEPLETGPFGTLHPVHAAPVVVPDVLLVPLLAFDKTGHRLGYGAGYYDRTLSALRAQREVLAIGLAYDAQEVAALPAEANDQPLDMVVTERRILTFSPSPLPAA